MIAATDTQLMATGRRDTLRLVLTVLLGAAGAATGTVAAAAQAIRVEVWKDPSCGCCDGWIRHLRAAGFEVVVQEVVDVRPLKTAHEVPEELWSCHTAAVGGYLVEGHVPASDIYRLLAERPAAKGLSAPGMPPSSPGMDMPGTPYEVVAFGAPKGKTPSSNWVWARH